MFTIDVSIKPNPYLYVSEPHTTQYTNSVVHVVCFSIAGDFFIYLN